MPKIRYLAHGKTWEADGSVGMSLRDVSKTIDAPEGDACGGVCACSTCHVHVLKGKEHLSEAEEEEEDILDKAFDVRSNSRLGCQAKILESAGADDVIEVEITRESLDAYYNEHPGVVDPRKKR
jgi:ferredoxin